MATSTSTVAPPPGISVVRDTAPFTIRRRWMNPFAWAITAIAVLVAGFAIAIAQRTAGLPLDHPAQWIAIVLALVAPGLVYLAVVRLFNATRIAVREGRVEVRHGPLPWRRGATIDTAGADHVAVRPERVRYDGLEATFAGVWLVRRGGATDIVLDGDVDPSQARFVAQVLAERLRVGVRDESRSDAA
jgi:hypothetical protein